MKIHFHPLWAFLLFVCSASPETVWGMQRLRSALGLRKRESSAEQRQELAQLQKEAVQAHAQLLSIDRTLGELGEIEHALEAGTVPELTNDSVQVLGNLGRGNSPSTLVKLLNSARNVCSSPPVTTECQVALARAQGEDARLRVQLLRVKKGRLGCVKSFLEKEISMMKQDAISQEALTQKQTEDDFIVGDIQKVDTQIKEAQQAYFSRGLSLNHLEIQLAHEQRAQQN
jgi:hypothetical protein